MRALVLSGGGSKGAYQVGAIAHLMGSLQLDYDIVCGTSVGAINAAFISQYRMQHAAEAAEALIAMWHTVSTDKVRKSWFPLGVISALWKTSVYDSTPLQRWVRSGISDSAIKTSGRQLRMIAVSLGTSEARVVTEKDDNLAEWVLASSAFPVMLEPIKIGGDLWTDGGIRHVTPLAAAVAAGATNVDIVLCSDPYAKDNADVSNMHAIPQVLLRAIDVMNDQIARQDIDLCLARNELSTITNSPWRHVNLRVIKPLTPLQQDSLDFSPDGILKMIAIGHADAQMTIPS